ncbi:universal stress protein [Halobaculum sp. MBLA0143]|uniref:universal stress protein n=1 Tax=Halobaculum sp. MBLA0143 TaxID=3079933 RepID=UPI003523CAFD
MTLLVPYDGSELADTATVRAASFGEILDERVLAVTVVPRDNARYARSHEWLADGEAFHLDTVAERLRRRVAEIAPTAEFRYDLVDRNAPPGTISKRLRRIAADEDTSMLFVGSENAGRLTRSVASVGSGVAADAGYDVVIVRQARPAASTAVRAVEGELEDGVDAG